MWVGPVQFNSPRRGWRAAEHFDKVLAFIYLALADAAFIVLGTTTPNGDLAFLLRLDVLLGLVLAANRLGLWAV